MNIIKKILIAATIVAVALSGISYALSSGGKDWWSGLLQNIVAEVLGIGFGIFLPAAIAAHVAKSNMKIGAKKLLKMVKHLREDGFISKETARTCVVFAVSLLSESTFNDLKNELSEEFSESECPICGLKAEESIDHEKRCKHCDLPGNTWKDI